MPKKATKPKGKTRSTATLRHQLLKLTEKWAELLGVTPQWSVEVKFGSISVDNALAEVEVKRPYTAATITYDLNRLVGRARRDWELCVVHELMHIMLSSTDSVFGELFGEDTSSEVVRRFYRAHEETTDRLANAVVHFYRSVSGVYKK